MAKMTKKGRAFVSGEISQLMKKGPTKGPQKGKPMPQKQAVAVALSVARRKGFKSPPNPNEQVSIFDHIVQEGRDAFSSADPRQAEREARQRRLAQNRRIQVRRDEGGGNRMAYRPKKHAMSGPKKLSRWNETPPERRQIARAGAELGRSYAMANESIFDRIITEKELTTAGRKRIDPSNFAIPEKAPGSGSYPIHDLAHARNALARVSAHGSSAEQKRVEKAVYSKYPGLKARKAKREESVSLFDGLTQPATEKSMFDSVVQESVNESAAWDDKVVRTLKLAEELIGIRNSTHKS